MSKNPWAETLAQFKAKGCAVFENVSVYRANEMFGCISRTDCKWIICEEGVKYAQYDNAVKIHFLEKGKRTAKTLTLSYKPFFIAVPTAQAIEPDDWITPQADGSRVSRYSSHDERWELDIRAQLKAAGVDPLVDYQGWNSHEKFKAAAV